MAVARRQDDLQRRVSIVTTHYRYKRPPRKREATALHVPAIVTKASKRLPAAEVEAAQDDDRKPASCHREEPASSRQVR